VDPKKLASLFNAGIRAQNPMKKWRRANQKWGV